MLDRGSRTSISSRIAGPRALHVQVLGPVPDRTPESMAARRAELGLDDGYPHKQLRGVLLSAAGVGVLAYFIS